MNKITESKVKKVVEGILDGINAWFDAGKILCELIEDDSDIFKKIVQKYPSIHLNALLTLEKIGRKEIHPKVLLESEGSIGFRKLISLPYSKQEKYLDEPVPVVKIENGKPVTRLKKVSDLNHIEVQCVFNKIGINSEDAQLEKLKRYKNTALPSSAAYFVSNLDLVITRKCIIKFDELKKIYQSLDVSFQNKLKSLESKK